MSEIKPHKHAELIKAWADGATIQYKSDNGNWEDCCIDTPAWCLDRDYRIKPEPKPDVVRYMHASFTHIYGEFNNSNTSNHTEFKGIKDNLKLIFDGETGEIKDAEVIKK